jgi:hypothetical protein
MSSAPTTPVRRGDPLVAVLLGWFLPGAGHVYLGRARRGVLGFAVVGGLYLLGLALAGGQTFEFLDPELRSPFAVALTPELGNLGGLLWQLQRYGFGAVPYVPHPYPDTIWIGSALTALSGVGNVALLIDAHFEARFGLGRSPALHVFAGWALPGLGHWLQGRRLRGLLVGAALVGLFALGTFLAEGSNLSRERHFYYWAAQFLGGLPAVITEFVSGRPPVQGPIRLVDFGLTYAAMSGLLNAVVWIDVYGFGEARLLGRDPVQDRRETQARARGLPVEVDVAPACDVPRGGTPPEAGKGRS